MDSSFLLTWVVIPLLIFSARVMDVSIGSLRIIMLAKGEKIIAPLLGFFEVIIWVLAIGQVIQNLSNVLYYLAYGGGFAMGTFVGICIEERLAIGTLIIRIITPQRESELFNAFKEHGFGVTKINAEGSRGPVKIIFTIVRRREKNRVIKIINNIDPKAFYTIDEIRAASEHARAFMKPLIYKKSYSRALLRRRKKEK